MKKFSAMAIIMLISLSLAGLAFADVEADKKECMAKCEAAVKMIKDQGIAATLCEVNKKDGMFVKGSVYVFLQTMDGVMIGHPMKHALIGKNLIGLKDKAGKEFFKEFVDVAKKGSGWVDYMWPKPGASSPSPKTSYILRVDGDSLYFVGAGVYK